jgi:uroporphyrinogen decarboxylase
MPKTFSVPIEPNWRGLMDCIMRQGEPERVYHIELFLDPEVQDAVCREFDLLDGLDADDPAFALRRQIAIQRFMGYDYVVCGPEAPDIAFRRAVTGDTADLERASGRTYMDEHAGPITNWDEFEAFPWPDPTQVTFHAMEWYQEHLPEDMCVIAGLTGHFCEWLTWLMGYETLCYALYDQRDLVEAIAQRILHYCEVTLKRQLAYDRVQAVWGSDDMGYRSATLISPKDMRTFVLPGHKRLAQMTHEAGLPYLLHSCGNLREIMDDLVNDVGIDAKHSFEDTIESVVDFVIAYGDRAAALGGIDVDFLCRADEEQVRQRVRDTLAACQNGGGYCLGTGNSVANYIPLRNYLAMVDEGRRFRM